MKPTHKLSRRSFFLTVGGGVAAVGALGVIAPDPAEAFQCTDSDSGRYSDPAGRGRRCGRRRTGCTDSDAGGGSDAPNYGRCRARRTGCTDSDSGRYADQAGNGRCRRRRTCTDSDTGRYSDPAGRGRRC
jgi:hypothetical protein